MQGSTQVSLVNPENLHMVLEEFCAQSIELLRRKRKIMSLITRIYPEFSQESELFSPDDSLSSPLSSF